ncbi:MULTISPECIES: DUF3017 domain-containing protein [Corynebacterium]|uniref:DUF3017 domain-containing protein n=1 Tax=Corynebacterium TaxID=1716 RepID=UPI0025518F38|nr:MULTISPECIES: DUF3017 domain-containing protein [Corynebacterium]MDK6260680.1 DUF3017 domain-containing protein [Corynebacterium frankenforstense]MDK8896146.1 DUF3017 domain-containing protein [Corynebacterium sp. MSK006]
MAKTPIRPASRQEALVNPHDRENPPSRLSRRAQQAMLAVFLVGLVVVAVFGMTEHWRRSTFGLGAAFLWLAVMRACCDDSVIGLFSVRSRRFDVAFCTGVGALLAFLAASVDALGS